MPATFLGPAQRESAASIAKKARDAKVSPANDRIPNPYYNLNKQVGVIMVNALDLDDDLSFAEARTDNAICNGLVPVVFEDHIRLYAK